jgi:S-adenosylmethionine hydrolase
MSSPRRPRRAPCIALLTDYGLRDPYVGIVKALILERVPGIPLVDISHDIAPHDVAEGAYTLWAAHTHFPRGTVFLCVVDPGVGTERPIVILQTADHCFIAPDNGLLALVGSASMKSRTYVVSPAAVQKHGRHPISATFHGRDIIAPLASALARGIQPRALGTLRMPGTIADPFVSMSVRPREGRVLHVDRFGNLITNILCDTAPTDLRPSLRVNNAVISRWINSFAEGSESEASLIAGSAGLVEIVMKNGDASTHTGIIVQDHVGLEWPK